VWPSWAYLCHMGDKYVDANGATQASDNCWGQVNLKTTPGQ